MPRPHAARRWEDTNYDPQQRVICPSCSRPKVYTEFQAPRRTGIVTKDACTPCRRAAAAERKGRA